MSQIIPFEQLPEWRRQIAPEKRPLVVTNGCFDLLHVGHVRYLTQAADLGATLLVGINDDAGVRDLKGSSRPIHSGGERAEVLAALRCVSAVCIFPGTRAVEFLRNAQPEIYAKGGDYTLDELYPPEREVLESLNSRIEFLTLVAGKSTTLILDQTSPSKSA